MALNFRPAIFSGLLLLLGGSSFTTGQFKIIDSSSMRLPQHARNHNGNITIVQINPITTTKSVMKEDMMSHADQTTVEVEPRGFTVDDLKTTTAEDEIKKTTTVTESRNLIKILIETTSEPTVFRVGKLQEKALAINQGLLEPHFRRKSTKKPPNENTQIIRIQTISPPTQSRNYKRTIPTRSSVQFQRRIVNDNVIEIPSKTSAAMKLKLKKNKFRKFKSRCRCEKIANCPKLQISIQRCPQDYFMCCF